MLTVFRLIREKYRHEPLSVEGSRLFGGRWNPKGIGVLYATSTPELGLVETLAHAPQIRYEELPTYWLCSIEIPNDIQYYSRDQLPFFWQDETYERTQTWLTDWLANPNRSRWVFHQLLFLSRLILFHPTHADFAQVRVIEQEVIPVDRRLWRG